MRRLRELASRGMPQRRASPAPYGCGSWCRAAAASSVALLLAGCGPGPLPAELQELHEGLEEAAQPGRLGTASREGLEGGMRAILMPSLQAAGVEETTLRYRDDSEPGFFVLDLDSPEGRLSMELYYRPEVGEALRDALEQLEDATADGTATRAVGRFEIRAFAAEETPAAASIQRWVDVLPLDTLDRL